MNLTPNHKRQIALIAAAVALRAASKDLVLAHELDPTTPQEPKP